MSVCIGNIACTVAGALYGRGMQAFYLSLKKVLYVLAVLSPFGASFPLFVPPHLSQYTLSPLFFYLSSVASSLPIPLLCFHIPAFSPTQHSTSLTPSHTPLSASFYLFTPCRLSTVSTGQLTKRNKRWAQGQTKMLSTSTLPMT